MEPGEVKKYYRWNKGPYQNIVECYICEDSQYVWFESGNNILKELLDIDMHSSNEEEYNKSQVNAPQLQFNQAAQLDLGNSPVQQPKIVEKRAIQIILEKQKKFQNIEIPVNLKFNLPNEKSIEFMSTMFDEDDILSDITEFAYSQLSIQDITDIIKFTIKETIREKMTSSQE